MIQKCRLTWLSGERPVDGPKAVLAALHKSDRHECGSSKGISLLSITRKVHRVKRKLVRSSVALYPMGDL